jgi:hypothetical protein
MKFLRIGFIAALALALHGQALAATAPAAPGAAKVDQKLRDQGMKEAPAVVQQAAVDCAISDAYLMGNGEITVDGKKVKTSIYEVACGANLGYVLQSAGPGSTPQVYDCLTMRDSADKAIAAKAKPGPTCNLPANADPKQGLVPLLSKAGVNCGMVSAARWIGSSPTDKISLYETTCSNGSGYVLIQPLAGSTQKLSATDCMKAGGLGVECQLTTKDQIQAGIIKASSSANRPACMPTKARWVVSDPSTKDDYYEVGCADGATGYMFQTTQTGAFKAVIECVRATRIAGGCNFSQADVGQTSDSATYTKLAKQSGYDCNVTKYQSYSTENNGPREIVELACANHPEGAFAIVPTGAGQQGEYFNCVRAQDRGLTCHLSPLQATYAKISSQIAARGKTTCNVDGGRGIGKDTKGSEYIEVTCAGAPGLVLEYSKLPEETLVSALPCAQATIPDACKLKK